MHTQFALGVVAYVRFGQDCDYDRLSVHTSTGY